MIHLYLNGAWRLVLGDGNAVGNYAFVDDVVDGIYAAMEIGRNGQKYILGGENLSYNEFFDLVKNLSGKRYKLFKIPPSLAFGFSRFEELRARVTGSYPLITSGWVRMFLDNWECSSEKAERELGYIITPVEVAFQRTIDWIKSGKRIDKI
jgi:nucleoside-diphosphate-sugar epimerase